MENLEKGALWVGRSLLGLYFLLPGVAGIHQSRHAS